MTAPPAGPPGAIHHVELWVPDLERSAASWRWLLDRLGYAPYQVWERGRSWRLGPTYVVVEQLGPEREPGHDRHRAGLNHLAFHAASRAQADEFVRDGPANGWRPLFADRYPFAGGPDHYAAYLEDADGFEVELVAPPPA